MNYTVEKTLKGYQKHKLKLQIEAGIKERYDEYKEINSDFSDVQFTSFMKK